MLRRHNFFFLFVIFFLSCRNNPEEKKEYIELQGNAQGTTFTIKYEPADTTDLQQEISDLLGNIDLLFSTYKENSLVSELNRKKGERINNDSLSVYTLEKPVPEFDFLMKRSGEIYQLTGKAFNPAIMPLVRYWGFDKDERIPEEIDSAVVDSLLRTTDFSLVKYQVVNNSSAQIIKPEYLQLDFNAIAQGYTVDRIAELLEKNDIKNYMIELGGEVRTRGVNRDGNTWTIGIDKPLENNGDHELQLVLELDGKSLATSGNYRKFYEKNGKKITHTIDPATGFPADHNLLSASVVTTDCASADGYATAFMVMGVEKTKTFLKENPGEMLEVLLIYSDENNEFQTWMSEGMKRMVKE